MASLPVRPVITENNAKLRETMVQETAAQVRHRPRRACARYSHGKSCSHMRSSLGESSCRGKKRFREESVVDVGLPPFVPVETAPSQSRVKRARKDEQQSEALKQRRARTVTKGKAATRARKNKSIVKKHVSCGHALATSTGCNSISDTSNSRQPIPVAHESLPTMRNGSNSAGTGAENSNPNVRVLSLSPRVESHSKQWTKSTVKDARVCDDKPRRENTPQLETNSKIKSNTKIQIGNLTRRWAKNVTEMKDSTSLFTGERWSELASRLDADGFVLIRGVIPREVCQRARERVFTYLNNIDVIDASKEDKMKGVIGKTDANSYQESFAVKAHCGAEASERDFDPDVWKMLGNSQELTSVYKSEHLNDLLRSVLGASKRKDGGVDAKEDGDDKGITLCPLAHQTWVRLMTHRGATIEHADYYYFKKDTQIFDREAGYSGMQTSERPAETGALDEKSQCTFVKPRFLSENCAACGASPAARATTAKQTDQSALNKCTLCGVRLHTKCMPQRLQKALSLKHFAAEGGWHCEKCAQSNFGVYTTWLCLSDSLTPSNSSLAMCPETHRLKGFNEPKFKTQVPKDFKASLKWQIPSKLNMGDMILFNIKTIHAASVNVSKYFRFSIDTRFMLKCEHSGDLIQQVPSDLTEDELRAS